MSNRENPACIHCLCGWGEFPKCCTPGGCWSVTEYADQYSFMCTLQNCVAKQCLVVNEIFPLPGIFLLHPSIQTCALENSAPGEISPLPGCRLIGKPTDPLMPAPVILWVSIRSVSLLDVHAQEIENSSAGQEPAA